MHDKYKGLELRKRLKLLEVSEILGVSKFWSEQEKLDALDKWIGEQTLPRTAPAECLGNEVIRSAPKNSAESRAVDRDFTPIIKRNEPGHWSSGGLIVTEFENDDQMNAILALFAGGE